MERRRVRRTLGSVVAAGAIAGCRGDGGGAAATSPVGLATATPTETRTEVATTGPPAAGLDRRSGISDALGTDAVGSWPDRDSFDRYP